MPGAGGLGHEGEHQLQVEFVSQPVVTRHGGGEPAGQLLPALTGDGPYTLVRAAASLDTFLDHQPVASQPFEAAVDLPAVKLPVAPKGRLEQVPQLIPV